MTGTRLTTGILLVLLPLIFTAAFTGLQMTFDYPDILRQPASDVLLRFDAGGWALQLLWYGMMASALVFIPVAVGTAVLLRRDDAVLACLSATFGILAGLVQALGLLRWVFLVPALAASYVNGASTDVERTMATSLFTAANSYLGMGVGEHLGYLFTALWTATVALMVLNRWRWLALSGLAVAAGVAVGMLEPFGFPLAGTVNALSYSAWALWALVLGVLLLRVKQPLLTPAVPMAA